MRHRLPHLLALVLAAGTGFALRPLPTTAEPDSAFAAVPAPTAVGRGRFSHWLLVPDHRQYLDLDTDGQFDPGDRYIAQGKVVSVNTLGEQTPTDGVWSWVEDIVKPGGSIQNAQQFGRSHVPDSQVTLVVQLEGGAFTVQGGAAQQLRPGGPPVRAVIGGTGKYRTFRGYAAMEFAQNQEDVRLALTNR